MLVLALDTALGATSVALYDALADVVIASKCVEMERGQAEALMPMVAEIFTAAAVDFEQIDRFAVSVGPGSFTGLRIGIAAARGFGLAAAKPVVGVSCLAAFAAPYLTLEEARPVAVGIDARHGHLFFQLFARDGRAMAGPGLFEIEDAVRKIGDTAVVFVGNIAEQLAKAHTLRGASGAPSRMGIEQRAAPDIAWIARLGAAADPAQAPARPLYLRDVSATPQERGRIARV